MTAPATTRRAGPFNGNDSATAFPFTFKVFAKEDIQVQLTDVAAVTTTLVLDSDYSVSVNADQDASPGGTITYPISGAPLATGEKLVALGAIEYSQVTDLPAGGAYRAKVVEDALDRTVFQIQQLAEENSRALTLPASAATADTTLPAPAAGSVIGWDTSAQALVNYAPADLATVVVAGTSYTDIFSGTGSQVAFLLTANPGSVNALDIAISGVSQVNGVDFTVSGTTLTFTSAPPTGAGNIAVRYVAAVPVGSANAQDVTFLQSGTGAAVRNVQAKLRDIGVFASDFTGYDPTGATDSASAIQAAINYANTSGTHTVFITGKPKISSPLTYSTMLAMVGIDGGGSFTNSPDAYPNAIRCGGVTGYVFDQPDTVDGSGGLSLSNLCFDGRTGGVNSSTLQGLVNASTTAGTSSFFLRMNNCMVGGSNSATPILALSGEVFARFDNCFFANWPYGYGHKGGLASILATTITFNKCYWNSLRQVGEWLTNVTDVTYNDCVMESCVVGVAAAFTNVTFNNLYTENMGYDPSGTSTTTGLTARALGVTDAPAISGNVSAVFTNRYGQFIFNQPTIQTTVGGKKWFDGIGRGSASGGGGSIVINDIGFAGGVVSTLFAADADTPSSRANFEYHLTARAGQLYVSEADARMVTKGRVPILWSDTNSRIVEIDNGVFTMPPLAVGGLIAIPSIYPSGGTNRVGDVIKLAPSVFREGIRTAYRCVVAGTTASKWTVCDFIASSLSATVAAAGTMNLVASSADNPGELHVWEITASTGANIESRYRVSMQAFTGAGQLGVESIVTTRALSFSMTWGDPYTIVVTNGSGVSLNIYARLVSISTTHA